MKKIILSLVALCFICSIGFAQSSTLIAPNGTTGIFSKAAVGLDNNSTDATNPPTAPASGLGTRFMWIPSRSAFRVGTVGSLIPSAWDATKIGICSFASGYSTTADGFASTALGFVSTASGFASFAAGNDASASGNGSIALGAVTLSSGAGSTAMGQWTKATGDYSTAMGQGTYASGFNSTAMGYGTTASKDISTSMGYSTKAIGYSSTAIGTHSIASGDSSIAMGSVTKASGRSSIAMGTFSIASGDYATAMGYSTKAQGVESTAMGSFTTATGYASTTMGAYTTSNGIASLAAGENSIASGESSVAMGYGATASDIASFAVGYNTTAGGAYSTAMGVNANTNNKVSSFAIGGASTTSRAINDKTNQMKMHFDEYKFLTGANNDVTITDGLVTTSNSLWVYGTQNSNVSNYGYLGNTTPQTGLYAGTANVPLSIYSQGRVVGAEFDAFSDARHKKLLSISNGSTDLALLKQLKVSNYTFIDTVAKGKKIQFGFIAQQVEQVIPEAINKIQDYIPSVYDMAKNIVFDETTHTLTITTNKPHDFRAKDEIKLISLDTEHKVKVESIIDENTFVVANWEKPVSKLFVFGKQVNDFRTVDYNRLFTLGISAIQELSRENEEIKKQNAILKADLSARIEKLEAQLSAPQNRN